MRVIVTQKAKNNLMELFEYNSQVSPNYAIRIDKKRFFEVNKYEIFNFFNQLFNF